ncbi:MAG: penicillin-binding transpeptidase domain-containing protein [Phycisphaerae bacterium]
MYHQRVKIFAIIVTAVLAVCVVRLARMQLAPDPDLDEKIEQLRLQQTRTLQTARGKILDRNGNILAQDVPGFELHIGYELSSIADERVRRAKLLVAQRSDDADEKLSELKVKLDSQQQYLEMVMQRLTFFGPDEYEIKSRIDAINDRIWNLRNHLAWKRNYPDSNDFISAQPDPNARLLLAAKVDIAEMHESYPILDLQNEEDVFDAQIEFADVNGISIVPENHRIYPFGDAACQVIGWVRPEQKDELFADDPLFSYEQGEMAGFSGVEYVCEPMLRGRRGEMVYDIDRELVEKKETQVGRDVQLTLDIAMQKQIQNYLADCNANTNCDASIAVVVLNVAHGDILAMVSTPVFDLNRIRYDYAKIVTDRGKPLRNRTIESHYPPGSVVKPLILIAGLQEHKISSGEVIECPATKAPLYWPSCWIFNQYQTGHSLSWTNNARNAIRGSCNIYFSQLANRLDPADLQKWLFDFGYGHEFKLALAEVDDRSFRQVPGYISSTIPNKSPNNFSEVPPLKKSDLRWFGIGQGNLRVTPLQVANAMAAIARKGLYKDPRLIMGKDSKSASLEISSGTLSVIYDGMKAVVTEQGGTAHGEFEPMNEYFRLCDVTIYGKTGSTQAPEHAWFGGFAKDSKGRAISIAVVVEGGQHGSSDAAPLARDIIDFCIQFGYVGQHYQIISGQEEIR